MAVSLQRDIEAGRLTVVAEYRASVDRVWQLWSDPRQFERWWGPPTYPATVTEHELWAGGTVRYHMTGPEGDTHHGGWRVISVEAPHRLAFEDFFADEGGAEDQALPASSTTVVIEPVDADMTRMTIETSYASPEAMAQVLEMGMEEGITAALGQIDGILAEQPA